MCSLGRVRMEAEKKDQVRSRGSYRLNSGPEKTVCSVKWLLVHSAVLGTCMCERKVVINHNLKNKLTAPEFV